MNNAYIYDVLRTPRGKGKSSGALHEIKPVTLLKDALLAIAARNQLDTAQVEDLIVGCVTPLDDQGANIAKAALFLADWDHAVSGMQINRFCASGLEAVNLAATRIRAGWGSLIVAGGLESMGRVPMESDGGPLLFDPETMLAAGYVPQGIAADLIATREGFTREQLDEYALSSQLKAAAAWENDYFSRSVIPIYDQNNILILDKDEHVRPNTTLEKLAQLRPAFEQLGVAGFDAVALKRYPELEKIHHLHTAGNSSGIVDGAALVLVGSKSIGETLKLKPRAKILAGVTIGSEPTIMLQGPVPATRKALKIAGKEVKDIDLWEMNEAFASPVLKFAKDMNIDTEILNVNGGAIAMGHPLGATGAMLIGTLVDELERRKLKTGVVTLCVGGGMGIATVVEIID